MFYSIVSEKIDELYEAIVTGDLLVSLDSIKEFVYFIIVAEELQSKGQEEYSLSSFTKMLWESESLEDDLELYDFMQEYDRVTHHYTNLNFKKQVEAKIRAKFEEEKGKQLRFKGNKLYGFQKDEFFELMKIKSDSNHEFHKTYKRIVSEKGYSSRVTYTEFKKFHDYLFNLIDKNDPISNIRYYKLEKRTSFEIIKTILVAMKKNKDSRLTLKDEIIMADLLKVANIPLLTERYRLIEVYSDLDDFEDIVKWRYLVFTGINRFINYAIQYVKAYVDKEQYSVLEKYHPEKFQSIYTPDSFHQDYKMRKDFSASDFKKLMKYIDEKTKWFFNLEIEISKRSDD